jgi:sugar phosphate isomerase/epimerase
MDTRPDLSLKGRLPFRLGATSYVIPDEILPNVEFLAGQVDDIELIIFESHEISNLPDEDTVRRLVDLAGEHDLTYTVHLPLDTHPGHEDPEVRRQSLGKCLRVAERLDPVAPFAYVLHLHGNQRGDPPAEDLEQWQAHVRESLQQLCGHVDPARVAVETLDYDFVHIDEIVEEAGAAVCLDVGHLLVNGHSLERALDDLLPRTRVVHLHGVRGQDDHEAITHLPDGMLPDFLQRLNDGQGERVVTLEVFRRDDFEESVGVLREAVS